MASRTTSVDFGDIHLVLARSTLADARVRRQVFEALGDDSREANVFTFLFTQIEEATGTNWRKLEIFPGKDEVRELFTAWCEDTDEILVNAIQDAIIVLRQTPLVSTDAKKPSALSSELMSEVAPIPVH